MTFLTNPTRPIPERSMFQGVLCRHRLPYLRLGGPPRVTPGFFAAAVAPAVGAVFDFPGRGSLHPSFRSSFPMICGFGMAFPDSYCPTTCGFSLMAVANSFWVIFFAVRACIIAFDSDLSTRAIVPTSSASSSFFALNAVVVCADLFPPAPYLRNKEGKDTPFSSLGLFYTAEINLQSFQQAQMMQRNMALLTSFRWKQVPLPSLYRDHVQSAAFSQAPLHQTCPR